MSAVVINGACTEIVRRLYRAYTVYALRFYESLQFQCSVMVARIPCDRGFIGFTQFYTKEHVTFDCDTVHEQLNKL
jgi:hypothetical protein